MNQKSALLTYVVVSNERNTRVMSNEKWERPTLLIYQIKFAPTETHFPPPTPLFDSYTWRGDKAAPKILCSHS